MDLAKICVCGAMLLCACSLKEAVEGNYCQVPVDSEAVIAVGNQIVDVKQMGAHLIPREATCHVFSIHTMHATSVPLDGGKTELVARWCIQDVRAFFPYREDRIEHEIAAATNRVFLRMANPGDTSPPGDKSEGDIRAVLGVELAKLGLTLYGISMARGAL